MKTLRALKIIDYLKEKKHCSIEELIEHFEVSPATIHRDVAELAKDRSLRRVRGGVSLVQKLPEAKVVDAAVSNFSSRIDVNVEKKIKIAEQAVHSICDGDIIFLDSSTTTLSLARQIQKLMLSRLTVITNSVLILQEFHLFPSNFYLISLGGHFSYQLNSFLGKTTIETLKRLKIDKAYFSGVGITAEGLFTYHENHAEFLKEVLGSSRERYLLLDSTKFDREGLFKICPLSSIDRLYSDSCPPEYAENAIKCL